ncbi:MAG: prolipoprotein diacylglyceryl transferase [Shimia sp.]
MPFAIPFPDIGTDLFSIEIGTFTFALRWYALAYIAGIVIGWRIAAAALRRRDLWVSGRPPMETRRLEDFVTWAVLGIVLGGRLGFVLFYQPAYYFANPLEIPAVWQGGMSFHGGFLGVVVAAWAFSRRHAVPVLPFADLVALSVPPGLFLGRLANFTNGELWGRPTNLPWGVIFPGRMAQACEGVFGACARHPSQLYEAALEGILLGAALLWLAWRGRALARPGLVTGVFLAGYGAARFAVEFVRQPDPQFVGPGNPLGHAVHAWGLGLTMGQLLSLPMIAIGLWLMARARRGADPALGGATQSRGSGIT